MSEKKQNRKTFSQDFKVEAVKLVIEEGYTIVAAATNLGIGISTLGKWVRTYKREQDPATAFPGKGHLKPKDEAYRALERELAKVKRERDILYPQGTGKRQWDTLRTPTSEVSIY